MADLSEQEKKLFVSSYEAYQKSCDMVMEATQNLRRISTEARSQLAKVPIAPVQGVEHWDPAQAERAADVLKGWGQAHIILGECLVTQAVALRDTTDIATSMIDKAAEAVSG